MEYPRFTYEHIRSKAQSFLRNHHSDGTIPVPIEQTIDNQLGIDIVPTPGLHRSFEIIYSMTTSTPEDAPHGMEFLFRRHRLNVATSRARCVCILVGNPTLFEPDCRTPEQMRMANAFCRYVELARVVEVDQHEHA